MVHTHTLTDFQTLPLHYANELLRMPSGPYYTVQPHAFCRCFLQLFLFAFLFLFGKCKTPRKESFAAHCTEGVGGAASSLHPSHSLCPSAWCIRGRGTLWTRILTHTHLEHAGTGHELGNAAQTLALFVSLKARRTRAPNLPDARFSGVREPTIPSYTAALGCDGSE